MKVTPELLAQRKGTIPPKTEKEIFNSLRRSVGDSCEAFKRSLEQLEYESIEDSDSFLLFLSAMTDLVIVSDALACHRLKISPNKRGKICHLRITKSNSLPIPIGYNYFFEAIK